MRTKILNKIKEINIKVEWDRNIRVGVDQVKVEKDELLRKGGVRTTQYDRIVLKCYQECSKTWRIEFHAAK